jgi:hypothetical protein
MTSQLPEHAPRLAEHLAGQSVRCYAPGCERDGQQWVGALLLCAEHAQRWPKTWADLHPALVAP